MKYMLVMTQVAILPMTLWVASRFDANAILGIALIMVFFLWNTLAFVFSLHMLGIPKMGEFSLKDPTNRKVMLFISIVAYLGVFVVVLYRYLQSV